LLRRLEIGLLLVTNGKTPTVVEEALAPEPFNREISRRSAKRKKQQLLDELPDGTEILIPAAAPAKK